MLSVFEDGVVRRIFRPKRDEVTGQWRRLHNEELYNLYSSYVIRAINSRRMRWAEQVASMGEIRSAYSFLEWRSEGRRQLGRSGVDGRIILK